MGALEISLGVLVMLVALALAFDFMNGFHDAANSVATIVSTRVLTPRQAVLWAAFFNFVAAFVLGVAFANLAKGVPINGQMQYTGTFWTLLNPYGLIGGFSNTAGFLLYGALFITMKTVGPLRDRAQAYARRLWFPAIILITALLVTTYIYTDIISHLGVDPGIIPISAFTGLLLTGYFISRRMCGWAFGMMGAHLVLTLTSCFQMFHRTVKPAVVRICHPEILMRHIEVLIEGDCGVELLDGFTVKALE